MEITAEDGLSLFGDSVENIEFVIESEDESVDDEIGTKENPIVIHVTKVKDKGKGLIVKEHLSKFPGENRNSSLLCHEFSLNILR